jgi:DNA polymerase type B, organellar and viral
MLLYAHNGGRFDFYFLLRYLSDPLRIINGRIVSAGLGVHRVRDSFAVLPVPLRSGGQKVQIDYAHMEEEVRDLHKPEISAYLKQDCIALYSLVRDFREAYGDKLTIGGAAITELGKLHQVERLTASHDEKFRPYYFGGRVECLKKGVHTGRWQVWDVNSMYPYVMKQYAHPVGRDYDFKTDIPRALLDSDTPFFATIDATSRGAFPYRSQDHSIPLAYGHKTGRYHVTGHELRAALELDLVDVHNVAACFVATRSQTFGGFVDKFSALKIDARSRGDVNGALFAKLVLNSAYGKWGSNPDNYFDTTVYNEGAGDYYPGADWEPWLDYLEIEILRRPAKNRFQSYYDVACAASITGAARAILLRALHTVKAPIYCDTDSIICQNPRDLDLSETALGSWKLEAEGVRIAIGGKKLYALFDTKGVCQKSAAKGVSLLPHQIVDIAEGRPVSSVRDAPTFSLARPNGDYFVTRQIKGLSNGR